MHIGLAPTLLGFIGGVGIQELLIILVIVFLLFGARKLPEIMRSFGQGIREFKRESTKIMTDIESAVEEEPEQTQNPEPEQEPEQEQKEKETESVTDD